MTGIIVLSAALFVFVAGGLFGHYKAGKWKLEQLHLLPDEERDGPDVHCQFAIILRNRGQFNSTTWTAGKLRITNQRVIVAQEALFTKEWVIRCILFWRGPVPTDQQTIFPYPTFRVDSTLATDEPTRTLLACREPTTSHPQRVEVLGALLHQRLQALEIPQNQSNP